MNLQTDYLGLNLPHPFIAGASPLMDRVDTVRRLEDAGAAAVVLRSLFAEQLEHEYQGVSNFIEAYEESFAEATSYFPGNTNYVLGPGLYLEHLKKVREQVSIPVIGSLNGTDRGTWTEFAAQIESAGAHALELNLYLHPDSFIRSGEEIESECIQVIEAVRGVTHIPLAVKLSPFFSSIPHFARKAVTAGADALVLFNRYYQPSINIEELEIHPSLRLSDSSELLLRLRWISLLYQRVDSQLAVTGGVHTATDAIQAIMAGADVLQLVSVLLREGPVAMTRLVRDMSDWMEEKEYDSVEQLKGSMSRERSPHPEAFARGNYMKALTSFTGTPI